MKSIVTGLLGILLIVAASSIPTATLAQTSEVTEPETVPNQEESADLDYDNLLGNTTFGTEPFGPSLDENGGLTPPDEDEGAEEFKGPIYDQASES